MTPETQKEIYQEFMLGYSIATLAKRWSVSRGEVEDAIRVVGKEKWDKWESAARAIEKKEYVYVEEMAFWPPKEDKN